MILLYYRSIPPNTSLPIDQRWRLFEIDPAALGWDPANHGSVEDVIHAINDRKLPNVEPIPTGSQIFVTDTEKQEYYDLTISVKKAS